MLDQLRQSPIVPVFYHKDPDYACRIISACHAAGLRFFEFTNRGDAAFEVFSVLKKHATANCPGLSLGIGTIYTPDEAHRFIAAGAEFVVQPVTTAAVGEVCREASLPWIPGALSANEVWAAWQAGATAVKIFPGNAFGSGYLRALRGPMPHIPLMVTGGVEPTVQSICEWLDAGALAVGIGSQLFGSNGSVSDFDALTEKLSGLLEKLF